MFWNTVAMSTLGAIFVVIFGGVAIPTGSSLHPGGAPLDVDCENQCTASIGTYGTSPGGWLVTPLYTSHGAASLLTCEECYPCQGAFSLIWTGSGRARFRFFSAIEAEVSEDGTAGTAVVVTSCNSEQLGGISGNAGGSVGGADLYCPCTNQ